MNDKENIYMLSDNMKSTINKYDNKASDQHKSFINSLRQKFAGTQVTGLTNSTAQTPVNNNFSSSAFASKVTNLEYP